MKANANIAKEFALPISCATRSRAAHHRFRISETYPPRMNAVSVRKPTAYSLYSDAKNASPAVLSDAVWATTSAQPTLTKTCTQRPTL